MAPVHILVGSVAGVVMVVKEDPGRREEPEVLTGITISNFVLHRLEECFSSTLRWILHHCLLHLY